MSQKTPTIWSSNPGKSTGLTAFSDATVAYSSATQVYSNANSTLNDSGKTATSWATSSKTATSWNANPAATVNQYLFDSAAHTYDSAVDTYDGIVAGVETLANKTPTAWSSL